MLSSGGALILSGLVSKDQSAVLKPITVFFGFILNFFFEAAYRFTPSRSLGISIILLTVATRFLMLPLALKAQKSAMKMQALQPEMEKIKKKYEGKTDTDSQRKMSQEMQMLYSKNNVSLFGGCLPLLIQMPLFFALNFVMRQSFLFISKLGDVYTRIAEAILSVPYRFNAITPLAAPHIPKGMTLDLTNKADLTKVLNTFTSADWNAFLNSDAARNAQSGVIALIKSLLAQKDLIERFFGINLLENAGLAFPGVLIPICSALFMFLSSYMMNKGQKTTDPQAKTMQNFTLVAMPLFFGWSTINFPAGVGLYWTVSNVFQLGQQFALNRLFGKGGAGGRDAQKEAPKKAADGRRRV